MSDAIETLRAQLAQAEARAKAAEAEAARAQAEAARAALEAAEKSASGGAASPQQADSPVPPQDSPEPASESAPPTPAAPASSMETPTPPAPAPEPDAPLTPFAQKVQSAYSFSTPSAIIGSLLEDGHPTLEARVGMPLGMFNRHLLVAGATGTGKTRTLQLLTEELSAAGTPVLLTDVKGDLTGLSEPGAPSDTLLSRTLANGQDWAPAQYPVELLSLGGVETQFPGTTVRTSVSDFGPILLSRALSLNTTQEQSLQLIFSWADKAGLELVDLADLRSVISFLTSEDGKEQLATLGGVSKATAGVILRTLTNLEAQGGDQFFGEPAFDTSDLLRHIDGKGVISLLGVGDMAQRPALVSTVIMWLLADLFSGLPEVGDPERPKLVFFFDEAHLLFTDATKEFLRQVVQTVRLIRSKGVGIVFVTQTPKDIPADVLAQLGSRVQHALRAVTPEDQKKLRQTVETFPKTELALDEVLTTLGTGEAVVTVLGPDGRPTPVAPTKIWAPRSVMGPATPEHVAAMVAASPLRARYQTAINPESAEEKLAEQAEQTAARKEAEAAQAAADEAAAKQAKLDAAEAAKAQKAREAQLEREIREAEKERAREEAARAKTAQQRQSSLEKALGSMARSAGTQLGREITRSIFGTRRR